MAAARLLINALCARGGMVDAADLNKKLSALREIGDVELFKFGETFRAQSRPMAIPSQA